MEIRRIGWIAITPELFLAWLQLEGGNILDVLRNVEMDYLEFLIEHPDMPDNIPGAQAVHVNLTFERLEEYFSCGGINAVIRSGKRISPRREPWSG